MDDLRFLDPEALVNRAAFNERFEMLNQLMFGLGNQYLWSKEKDEVISYVNSSSPDAYPPAEPDGYTYTALGQLGSKVRIETGSYIGTGTYGSSNPNSIKLPFAAKMIFMSFAETADGIIGYFGGSNDSGITVMSADRFIKRDEFIYNIGFCTLTGHISSYGLLSADGLTYKWYDTGSADAQFNKVGLTYHYIAIG